jgi:hypothetical protein
VDVDWSDAGLSLRVADLEACLGEADVLVIERAQLADARSGQAEGGDHRPAWTTGRTALVFGASVEVDRCRRRDLKSGGDRLPLQAYLVTQEAYPLGLLHRRGRVAAVKL